MTIIKKSGRKEEYSAEKLSNSIAAASDEAREPLNESDLKLIITEFNQIISGKELMTTQQIDVIVSGLLYSKNRRKTLEQYMSYIRKR